MKISVKTKKKRSSRPQMFCFHCYIDHGPIYQLICQRGGGARGPVFTVANVDIYQPSLFVRGWGGGDPP